MDLRGSTFHESWYKVSSLKPRLNPSVHVSRQTFRGRKWQVLRDRAANQFFRLNEPAWRFIALLDGRLTVEQAWQHCYQEFGDLAPTQGEAISLLGQLYCSSLLQGDVADDTRSLLLRHKKKKQKQGVAQMRGILFARVPLFDPDDILRFCRPFLGWIFSKAAMLLGLAFIVVTGLLLLGRFDELRAGSDGQFSLSNAPAYFAVFLFTKILHEFGHGIACRHYGSKDGSGGEVRVFGIALMMLTPVPYVDCTSSWAFRSKWRRIAVAGAGMYCELMFAAAAAFLWMNTSEGSFWNVLSWQIMLVAGVTTVLFNANPLLRYDGYYMLADFLEIPNLAGRAKLHLKYLCRRWMFGVKRVQNPAHMLYESLLLPIYGVAAEIYKIFLYASIAMVLNELSPVLGITAVLLYLFSMLLKPLGQLIHYLLFAQELSGFCRWRAQAICITAVAGLTWLFVGTSFEERVIVEGVVEPRGIQQFYVQTPGFVDFNPWHPQALQQGEVFFNSSNEELSLELSQLQAQLDQAKIDERAYTLEPARRDIYREMQKGLELKITNIKSEIQALTMTAPFAGQWQPQSKISLQGRFLQRGELLGQVYDPQSLLVRTVIDQQTLYLLDRVKPQVELRARGRAQDFFQASLGKLPDSGKNILPSQALGYLGGGEMAIDDQDKEGTRSEETFFEVPLHPQGKSWPLRPGQVVHVRFVLGKKTLYQLSKEYLQRLLLSRFKI